MGEGVWPRLLLPLVSLVLVVGGGVGDVASRDSRGGRGAGVRAGAEAGAGAAEVRSDDIQLEFVTSSSMPPGENQARPVKMIIKN
jgi:uncharacterized spore protein YtfJ